MKQPVVIAAISILALVPVVTTASAQAGDAKLQ